MAGERKDEITKPNVEKVQAGWCRLREGNEGTLSAPEESLRDVTSQGVRKHAEERVPLRARNPDRR